MLDGQLFTSSYYILLPSMGMYGCYIPRLHVVICFAHLCELRLDAQPAVLKAGITDARAAAATSEAPGILQA